MWLLEIKAKLSLSVFVVLPSQGIVPSPKLPTIYQGQGVLTIRSINVPRLFYIRTAYMASCKVFHSMFDWLVGELFGPKNSSLLDSRNRLLQKWAVVR